MTDHVYDYLKKKGPVTREDYINLNWMGDIDGVEFRNKPLDAELEAEMPEELQFRPPATATGKADLEI